jgi:hypothetical protein
MKKIWLILLVNATIMIAFYIPAAADSTGTIIGTVYDMKTGQPIPGTRLMLDGTRIGAATNIYGTYKILDIIPGKYLLKASVIGYGDVITDTLKIVADSVIQKDFYMSYEPIDITDIKRITRPDQVPIARCAILGIVIDSETGDLVPGAKIVVKDSTMQFLVRNNSKTAKFSIAIMHPGLYDLSASCIGYDTAHITNCPVKSNETTNIVFSLVSSALREPGNVTNGAVGTSMVKAIIIDSKTKKPISEANITIENTNIGMIYNANLGAYYFNHIPAGKYRFLVKAVGYKSLYRDLELGDNDTVNTNFELDADNN